MTENDTIKHSRCGGGMWVCETHPSRPQGHGGCGSPGLPCGCNRSDPPASGFDEVINHV